MTCCEQTEGFRLRCPVAALVFFAALGTALIIFVHRVWTSGDNLDFMIMMRAIQRGDWSAALPWRYPVGYPAISAWILSATGYRLPDNFGLLSWHPFIALKLMGVLTFGVGSVVSMYWLRAIGFPRVIAFAAAMLTAVNQPMAAYASVIGSDIFFLPFVWAGLLLWERSARLNGNAGWAWAACGFSVLAVLIREVGFAVGMAALAWVLFTWKRRRAVFLVFPGVMILLAYAGYLFLRGSQYYWTRVASEDPLGTGVSIPVWEKVIGHVPRYVLMQFYLLFPRIGDSFGLLDQMGLIRLVPLLAWILLALLVTAYVLHVARGGLRISHFYLLASGAAILLWPRVHMRYAFPIQPLLMALFIWLPYEVAGMTGGRRLGRRIAIVMASLLFAWGVFVNGYAGIKNIRNIIQLRDVAAWHPERYRIAREYVFADFMEALMFLKVHTPPEALIVGYKASFIELGSARRAISYRPFFDAESLARAIRTQAVDRPVYILRDNIPPHPGTLDPRTHVLDPFIRLHHEELEKLEWAHETIEIYRFTPEEAE